MSRMPRIKTLIGDCCLFIESGFMGKERCLMALYVTVLEPMPVKELASR